MSPAPAQPLTGRRAASARVPVGWAQLRAEADPTLALLAELGDSAPRVVQGYGGFEEVDRRGRISLTDWVGFKPVIVELDLTLDDADAGLSIEAAIDMLEGLAGRGRRTTGGEPPQVVIDTAGVMPHDHRASPNNRWVLNDLEWGDDDETIVNAAGNRIRIDVTVTALQYVADSRVVARRRNQAAAKKKGAKRRYTVKSGDTLQSIARKELGDAGRWPEIAKLNGLRDPRYLKAGRVLKLP